ncbi:MAG: hypothetical protein FJ095_10565 [Deltaproteobacteria bacterium]|nr:hypothetical protein [Deltaproteobacteria bacterium]
MADEITQKHLNRARVRGAPSSIPGASGLIGSYAFEEIQRQTVRAIRLSLDKDFSLAELRDAQEKLAAHAARHGLVPIEAPMFALAADPMEQVPHEWEWHLFLPVRGKAVADEAAGIRVERLHGGSYLETQTMKGFQDLRNLYTYFLGEFLPTRAQQLTRPAIYHRVVAGLEGDDPSKLTLSVFIPFGMSLREPLRLVTREEL